MLQEGNVSLARVPPLRQFQIRPEGKQWQGRALLVWAVACLGLEETAGTLSTGYGSWPGAGRPHDSPQDGWPQQPGVWEH